MVMAQSIGTMRVALPVWENRISPVLDAAERFLLVEFEDGQETGREEIILTRADTEARTRQLKDLGIETLLCGAVSRPLESLLVSSGMRVIARLCGPAEEILRAFLSGNMKGQSYLMPGCCRRRRRFRGG